MIRTTIANEPKLFDQLLALQGQDVEISLNSAPTPICGKVVYTNPDSFLLETNECSRIIPFADLFYVKPL